jgi:hypothetical protein
MKPAVLALLRLTNEQERACIAGLSEAERGEQGTPERWSAKDMIGHVTAWKRNRLGTLADLLRGQEPSDFGDVDTVNARQYAEQHGRSWTEVAAERDRVSAEYAARAAQLSEEELANPTRTAALQGMPLGEWFLGNGAWHPYLHLVDFWRGRGEAQRASGSVDALAEAADRMTLPPRLRGVVLYNLACWLALTGRSEQALERLPETLRLRPDLTDLARQDPDLDSLRAEPGFQALVGTGG